jgi:hypothetical protein
MNKNLFILPNGDKAKIYRKISNIRTAQGSVKTLYVLFLLKDNSCVIHLD